MPTLHRTNHRRESSLFASSTNDRSPPVVVLLDHGMWGGFGPFAYTTGKNASDITLVISAMDLLHSGRFDGFCLVSSDSDFTRLASRIREQGIDVFGFGEQKTPESFRQSCLRFIYTENLLPPVASNGADATQATPSLQQPSAATPIIKKVIAQMESEDGWVPLGAVGTQLANLASDFDPRTYGSGS